MKYTNVTRLKVIAKFKQPSADGAKQYPKLSVLSGYEAGTIGCSEDIYNAVVESKAYDFESVYDDKYGNFKLARIIGEVK